MTNTLTNHTICICCVKVKTTTVVESRGRGSTSVKKSIFYMLNSKNRVFNVYLSNEKKTFADKSRIELFIIFIEKISFSLKLLSSKCYGQSCIKTVRGPLPILVHRYTHKYCYLPVLNINIKPKLR